MFTARYGLIPYIKQIMFRLYKVNVVMRVPKKLSSIRPVGGLSEFLQLIFLVYFIFCRVLETHKFTVRNSDYSSLPKVSY